jgi:hypothetical protein
MLTQSTLIPKMTHFQKVLIVQKKRDTITAKFEERFFKKYNVHSRCCELKPITLFGVVRAIHKVFISLGSIPKYAIND